MRAGPVLARVWSTCPAPGLGLALNAAENEGLARTVWGVAALLLACADALNARFAAVTVRGELSGLSRPGSGHLYFALKDAGGAPALLRCAMFRRAAVMMDFTPADGQQVELRGRLAVYEQRGELQFVVEAMKRVGSGALYEEFLRKKALLQAQGWFDVSAKRALPPFPRAVGIITSTAAAALSDVLAALARRAPHLRVVVYPSLVQGAQAPAALVQALQLAGQRREVDVLLLVRGGGSLEDLWAFNDEALVRAIRGCPLPVISGVGHESDISLADLAADLRAATPTAAAELAAPPRDELRAELALLAARAARAVQRRLDTQAQRLDFLGEQLAGRLRGLRGHQQRLALLALRLRGCMARRNQRDSQALAYLQARCTRARGLALAAQGNRLAVLQARLTQLDPQHVLERGYAIVAGEAGNVLMAPGQLSPGATLNVRLARGQAKVVIERRLSAEAPPET